MKYGFWIVLFYLVSAAAIAQEKIETDRPDQTETPFLVPQGWFQAEIGFNKENDKGNNYTLVHPTALLKYGFSKKFELRLETNVVSDHEQLMPDSKTITGLLPVEIGAKIFLAEEKGLRPKTSLIVHAGLPFFSSRPFHTPHLVPSFRFTMQNSLTNTIAVGYNVGAEWDGITTTPSWLYTFAPGFELGARWYAYVEAFGFVTKGQRPQHNLDSGIAYFLSNNHKLDLSGGVGLSPDSFKNYIAVGYSFRIAMSKRAALK